MTRYHRYLLICKSRLEEKFWKKCGSWLVPLINVLYTVSIKANNSVLNWRIFSKIFFFHSKNRLFPSISSTYTSGNSHLFQKYVVFSVAVKYVLKKDFKIKQTTTGNQPAVTSWKSFNLINFFFWKCSSTHFILANESKQKKNISDKMYSKWFVINLNLKLRLFFLHYNNDRMWNQVNNVVFDNEEIVDLHLHFDCHIFDCSLVD